jgi:iron complex outermembrane receptor protein
MFAPQLRLGFGVSAVSLIIAAGLATPVSAVAQNQTKPNNDASVVEEVVVTGTSIRGSAPVGSALVAVGRQEIEKTSATTVQQILKTVPSIVGQGSAGQGSFGSADNSGTNAPTIHGLGASASNSTLILIDGHRIPLTGINHALTDPNVIAPAAIERVEVLADGASSVYGSDAVAGVINFITRKNFDGLEVSGQVGFADKYDTKSANILWGKRWDDGSALVSYGYSNRSNLLTGDRDFTSADHRPQGGTNLSSFNCGTASVQPAGSSLIFAAPYTGAGVANASANAFCDYSGVADLLPSEERHSVLAKIRQDFGDRLTAGVDLIYSKRNNHAAISRGSVTTTVYGPGSGRGGQINPFYVNPTGSAATSQNVRWDANDLLGPGAYADSGATSFTVNGEIEYKLTDRFILSLGGTAGQDESREQRVGALCTSCANLGLNGTTNGSGALTTPSIPGTSLIVLNTPLTGDNALDVWHTGSANQTSAAVRKALADSTQTQIATQTLEDLRLKIDGALFSLPGGDVSIAVGGEYTHYTLKQDLTRPTNIGPATLGSATVNLNYGRTVKSGFVELLVPIIGEGNALPMVQKLDLNLAGRYDKYSDFGSTKNPKIAVNWTVVDGVKLRGNWAKSFVAPAFTSIGSGNGITGESGYGSFGLGAVNVPVSAYPSVAQLPGCATATTCTLGTTITGLQLNGGNDQLQPQRGKSWAIGVDLAPTFLPGFRGSVTYWSNKLSGGITSPIPSLAVNSSGLNSLLQIYPNGATPAQIAAAAGTLPQTSAIPSTVYFIYDYRQRNVLYLDIAGIDFDGSYRFNTPAGELTLGGSVSRKTKFDQHIGADGATFDVLNTTGFNTTFPSIKTSARGNVSWSNGPWSADLFANYTGSYYNWSGTTQIPLTRNAAGLPTGGGDKVKSSTIFDLHVAYDIKGDGWLGDSQVYIDGNNIFDKDPVFYNNANGYDTFSGNPIGRMISVGFRAKL